MYQPIVDLVRGGVVGAEALARWPHLGVTPDAAFAWARRHPPLLVAFSPPGFARFM